MGNIDDDYVSDERFPGYLVDGDVIRCDPAGSGHYRAPRGMRRHKGVDLLVQPGEGVKSPIPATVERYVNQVYPYPENAAQKRMVGIVLAGTGKWSGLKLKIFYMVPSVEKRAALNVGDPIGIVQDVREGYPGREMLNHIHVEVRIGGKLQNPENFLKQSGDMPHTGEL